MLTHIHVRNLAIVDEIEVELTAGMTTLTGETGAGKSILVDALGLVLGDRADSAVIRHGCERAEISAGFDIKDPKNLAFAKSTDYQHQGEYRLVFGTRKAFKLIQQIVVNQRYDFRQEAMKGTTKEKLVEIGSNSDLVKVHYT